MNLGRRRARLSAPIAISSLALFFAPLAHAAPEAAASAPAAAEPAPPPASDAASAAKAARERSRQEQPQAGLDTLNPSKEQRPWAEGVSEERQELARQNFAEANRLLRDSLFAEAAATYRKALDAWDHPGIHYNLALALINLERPLEVREHLVDSLRYGPEPLDADKFNHVQSYLKLIEQQLAPVEIVCDVPGAEVLLDGRVLFRAPNRYRDYVEPGERVIRARRAGFVQSEYHRTLLPGRHTTLHVNLYREAELVEHQHRFPGWIPVAVGGAGVVLTSASVLMLIHSNRKLSAFDDEVRSRPDCSNGCVADAGLSNQRDTGNTYRTLSTIGFVAGGSLLVGSGILFYLNRDRPYRITPEQRDRKPLLQPFVAPGVAGLFASGKF